MIFACPCHPHGPCGRSPRSLQGLDLAARSVLVWLQLGGLFSTVSGLFSACFRPVSKRNSTCPKSRSHQHFHRISVEWPRLAVSDCNVDTCGVVKTAKMRHEMSLGGSFPGPRGPARVTDPSWKLSPNFQKMQGHHHHKHAECAMPYANTPGEPLRYVFCERPRCPKCHSTKVKTRSTRSRTEDKIVQLRRCELCRHNFTVVWG